MLTFGMKPQKQEVLNRKNVSAIRDIQKLPSKANLSKSKPMKAKYILFGILSLLSVGTRGASGNLIGKESCINKKIRR